MRRLLRSFRRWLAPTWRTPYEDYKLEDITDFQLQATEWNLARLLGGDYAPYQLTRRQAATWWRRFDRERARRRLPRIHPEDAFAVAARTATGARR